MPELGQGQYQDLEALKQRIQTLEHALDQALLVIQDLRNQLRDQDHLEEQLAATEEFAYIQQKAVQSLQTQLVEQTLNCARLQQCCQELEQEQNGQQVRSQDLERQLTDLQEQVLHQVRQASEYEAAIQHWKHRYQTLQQAVLRLKAKVSQGEILEMEDFEAILIHLTQEINPEEQEAPDPMKTQALLSGSRVDLPTFLVRRSSLS